MQAVADIDASGGILGAGAHVVLGDDGNDANGTSAFASSGAHPPVLPAMPAGSAAAASDCAAVAAERAVWSTPLAAAGKVEVGTKPLASSFSQPFGCPASDAGTACAACSASAVSAMLVPLTSTVAFDTSTPASVPPDAVMLRNVASPLWVKTGAADAWTAPMMTPAATAAVDARSAVHALRGARQNKPKPWPRSASAGPTRLAVALASGRHVVTLMRVLRPGWSDAR